MKTELTEKDLELISESLDEDLSEFERRRLVQKVLTTEEGEKTWIRYYAIRAVITKQFPTGIDKSFSQGVMEAIKEEHIEDTTAPRTSRGVGSHLKQFAGLTVAASVAALSIVTFQHFIQPVVNDSPQIVVSEQQVKTSDPATQFAPSNPAPVINPIKVQQVDFEPAQLSSQDVFTEQPFGQQQRYSNELDPYMHKHAGYGSQRTMTPYVDIIELKDVQN